MKALEIATSQEMASQNMLTIHGTHALVSGAGIPSETIHALKTAKSACFSQAYNW